MKTELSMQQFLEAQTLDPETKLFLQANAPGNPRTLEMHHKIILSPTGSGKSHFINIWGRSVGCCIDAGNIPVMLRLYATMANHFGREWYYNEEALTTKDDILTSILDNDSGFGILTTGRVYFTAEYPFIKNVDPADVAVVVCPFEEHERWMTARNNRSDNAQPVLFGDKLTALRSGYYALAERAGLVVYNNFTQAFRSLTRMD